MSHNLSIEKIKDIINSCDVGLIFFNVEELLGYNGVYEEYHLVYDIKNGNKYYYLRNRFVCYVLDFFGDDLYKDHEYNFLSIEKIVEYVEKKLGKTIKDMITFDRSKIPTTFDITDEEKRELEENWKRFEIDFDEGKFLDRSLKLI